MAVSNGAAAPHSALLARHDTRQCLDVRDGPYGRGLFVRRDMRAGEPLLTLPSSSLLHVKSAAVAKLLPHDVLPSRERPSHPKHWELLREAEAEATRRGARATSTQCNGKDKGAYLLPLTSVQSLTLILARWRAQRRRAAEGSVVDELLDDLLQSYPDAYPGIPLIWQLLIDDASRHKEQDGIGVRPQDTARRRARASAATLCQILLERLPCHIAETAWRVAGRFRHDLWVIEALCAERPDVLAGAEEQVERLTTEDIAWAWCSVNSRCVYLALGLAPHGDNFTLAPLLDMANHTTKAEVEAKVRGLPARSLDLRAPLPINGHAGGYNEGDEVLISYGPHSDKTLLTEYGFCFSSNEAMYQQQAASVDAPWPGNPYFEVNVDRLVVELLEAQGEQAALKKHLLQEEGYWLDYTIHPCPGPAYPSHRLVTALRLIVVDLQQQDESRRAPSQGRAADCGLVLNWRAAVRGIRETVSAANEAAVRALLASDGVCGRIMRESDESVAVVMKARDVYLDESSNKDMLNYDMTRESLLQSTDAVIALLSSEKWCAHRLCTSIKSGIAEW